MYFTNLVTDHVSFASNNNNMIVSLFRECMRIDFLKEGMDNSTGRYLIDPPVLVGQTSLIHTDVRSLSTMSVSREYLLQK